MRPYACDSNPAETGDRCALTIADYLPILMMLVVGALFGAVSMFVSKFLAPRRPTRAKLEPYECGIVADKEPPERFPVRFYMVAMLFILFDIEIVFMYPWAVAYGRLGLFGFFEMAVFLLILLGAYAYIWREGVLDWAPRRALLVGSRNSRESVAPHERGRAA